MPFIRPDWPTPPNVQSLLTTRRGGVSQGVYQGFNLGLHVGDDQRAVNKNRAILHAHISSPQAAPRCIWLEQVHGTQVIDAGSITDTTLTNAPLADASFSRKPSIACTIMVADCLPILFCDEAGTVVAAAHAGWRSLLNGVVEATIERMVVAPSRLLAYLGPAIGAEAFEVGKDVYSAFVSKDPEAAKAFVSRAPAKEGKYFANLALLATQRLNKQGLTKIFGGNLCTYQDSERFFSYRRDGITGRQAALIWLSQ